MQRSGEGESTETHTSRRRWSGGGVGVEEREVACAYSGVWRVWVRETGGGCSVTIDE